MGAAWRPLSKQIPQTGATTGLRACLVYSSSVSVYFEIFNRQKFCYSSLNSLTALWKLAGKISMSTLLVHSSGWAFSQRTTFDWRICTTCTQVSIRSFFKQATSDVFSQCLGPWHRTSARNSQLSLTQESALRLPSAVYWIFYCLHN